MTKRLFIIGTVILSIVLVLSFSMFADNLAINTNKLTTKETTQLTIGSLKGEYHVDTIYLAEALSVGGDIPYEITIGEGTLSLRVQFDGELISEEEVRNTSVGLLKIHGEAGNYEVSILTEKAKDIKLTLRKEVIKDRDWSEFTLFDWGRKEIRLSDVEYQQYLNWVNENEIFAADVSLVGNDLLEVRFFELEEYSDILDFTEEILSIELQDLLTLNAEVADLHLREAYKASTYYQNQQEPTIQFFDLEGDLIVEYNTSSEQRRIEKEQEEERNRVNLGTFRMREPIDINGDVITITGGTTVARRLENELYSPNIVVRLGIQFENIRDVGTFASAKLFSIKDSWGQELEIYPFEENLGEIVKAGEETHGPVYFVASGKGPYEVTYTTTKAKVTWVVSDRELGIY
ncbi:hypothetical protein [Anaerobacillus alkaliphilus]|uniref:hypothetical protein n=1 Tax=Anaerobacillus alkaliphilus TaxID=1548597 RepID=UPI00100BF0F0|nr:hypothetical protein [Anaerobacillus alkaliphilus]